MNKIIPKDALSYNTIDEAIEGADNWDSPIHSIRHIIKYDGKYYIKGHINCESCEHCGDLHAKNTRHAITIPTKFIESRYID